MSKEQKRAEHLRDQIERWERMVKSYTLKIMEYEAAKRRDKIRLQEMKSELFNLQLTPAERTRVDADNAGFRD